MYNHTPVDGYVHNLASLISPTDHLDVSPSNRIVRLLQARDLRIATKGFRSNVLKAIFRHALLEDFNEDEQRLDNVIARLERRFGKKRAKNILNKRCDVLDTWRTRDSRFIPDAYLIDAPNWTVVCYEVEDTHPLNLNSITEYAAAWWTLDYIYWDLHLISYDIYGHHRVHQLGWAGMIAEQVRNERKRKA